MSIPHQTETVASGGLTLHYRRLGRAGGTPVVFVHGLSYFSYDWLEAAQALAGEREVVCLDQRGFGDSDWSPTTDYSVPTMAQDLLALLDHLGWKRTVLVGHSMGGRATSYLAATQPGRVAGLVLVDYTPENAPAGTQRVARTVAGTPERFASVDEAMAYFKVDSHSPQGASYRARFEAYLKPVEGGYMLKRDTHFRDQFRRLLETGERAKLGVDMWQVLGQVRAPLLVMRGTRSDMFAPESISKVSATLPQARIVEINAGHNIAGDNLEGFLGALRPFLSSLES